MNVLSLFDGIACGMIAAKKLGLQIDSYDAYEIDKYAIKTATHNFPEIMEHGDVFKADFSKFTNIDFIWGGVHALIGLSPEKSAEKLKLGV